ncbi:MAG: sulfotransferase [Halieaceae bacterium]
MKSPIFMFGSGRCGSTLLQRALNAHPEVVMYGEHEGFLAPISHSYYKLTETRDIQRWVYGEQAIPAEALHGQISDMEADICWVNNFTRDEVYQQHRQLVLSLLTKDLDLDQVHWGFKEIRYHKGQHVIWFLREMFPQPNFIFLFRNPAETIASGMTAWEDPEKIMHDEDRFREDVWQRFLRWTSKYVYLLNHLEELGDKAYLLKYEDLVSDPETHMNHIFGMLGLDTPAKALDMFQYRVASTQNHPHKAFLVERIQEFQRNCKHPEFRDVCARIGYEYRT